MSNISTATRYLANAAPNPQLIDLNEAEGTTKPFQSKDNADFLAEVARRLARWGEGTPGSSNAPKRPGRGKDRTASSKASQRATPADADPMHVAKDGVLAIGLLGEYGQLGYALRRAQEVLRIDRTPSYWSHAFLFLDPITGSASELRDPARSPRLLEATVQPGATASQLFAFRNGANVRRFADYARADLDASAAPGAPNIAVLCFAMSEGERAAIRDRALHPEADLLSYDLPDLLGTWFHYALSLGKRSNPLVRGIGLPSASYCQLAYDAAGIDLAPGANDRNAAPEHLWQAARFLYPMFAAPSPDGTLVKRQIVGYHCVREVNCVVGPPDVELLKSFEAFVATR
jgi:hypothetical protein